MQTQPEQTTTEVVDFFLADDILQGENAPFFVLWKNKNPLKIQIEYTGFKSLIELHNSPMEHAIIEGNEVVVNNFVVDGYLGGLLSTEITEDYNLKASLKIKIFSDNDTYQLVEEHRIIYGTVTSVSHIPTSIHLSESSQTISEYIEILLCGKTTVFLHVEELEDNECDIDVPVDIKEELERVTSLVNSGLKRLKEKYPQHSEVVDLMLKLPGKKISASTYVEELEDKIDKALEDEPFAEELITLLLTALFQKNSLEELLLKPLNEYFRNYSKDKAYFSNPLLSVNLHPGTCRLAIKLRVTNLLNEECGEPIEIKTVFHSDYENSIPLRELLCLRRTEK
jgi:hypothetical protein